MKTLLGWSVLATTLCVSAVAMADEPVMPPPTTTPPATTPAQTAPPAQTTTTQTSQTTSSGTAPVAPAAPTGAPVQIIQTPVQPAPLAQPGPTSTTTVTSADGSETATITPNASRPSERDTTTLYRKTTPNKKLLITGGVVFLGTYVPTAALTAANTDSQDRSLYIPVVGPWLALADRPDNSPHNTRDTILIAGSGVLQGVGVAMMAASLFVPEKVPAATIQAGNTKVHFAPTSFGVASAGAAAVGTF